MRFACFAADICVLAHDFLQTFRYQHTEATNFCLGKRRKHSGPQFSDPFGSGEYPESSVMCLSLDSSSGPTKRGRNRI